MNKKINATDVTFLISFRADSMDRLENLIMVTDFLSDHFNTHIHVLETASYNNQILKKILPQHISVTFTEDPDPIYHRTKYVNRLIKKCHTPYLAVWDADVIAPPRQVLQSLNCLRNKEAHFVSPYENKCLDISYILRELYFKTRDFNLLKEHAGKMKEMYFPNPVGGGFFADKASYIKAGMENEYYYGWGREDGDRINRWKILEYTYKRIPGPLFHLTHKRAENSTFHSAEQRNIKISEIHRIAAMSQNELKAEIETWKH